MSPDGAMTAGELREQLEEMPDDAPVAYEAAGLFEYIHDAETMEPLKTSETTVALHPSDD